MYEEVLWYHLTLLNSSTLSFFFFFFLHCFLKIISLPMSESRRVGWWWWRIFCGMTCNLHILRHEMWDSLNLFTLMVFVLYMFLCLGEESSTSSCYFIRNYLISFNLNFSKKNVKIKKVVGLCPKEILFIS